MISITSLTKDVIHLLYPHQCNGCESDLLSESQLLCIYCLNDLPHTNFANFENNNIEKIFTGRINIHAAHSEFYFAKGRLIQQLIHQLKYNGNHKIGHYLGSLMGKTLMESGRFHHIDAIVPLPMHKKKEFKRGYNQAKIIADGVAEVLGIPVLNNVVIKSKATDTQTRKQRLDRWENVEEAFLVVKKEMLEGKNILLTDDVVTTGATLEACGNAILKIKNTTVSIASLAIAGS